MKKAVHLLLREGSDSVLYLYHVKTDPLNGQCVVACQRNAAQVHGEYAMATGEECEIQPAHHLPQGYSVHHRKERTVWTGDDPKSKTAP